MTTGNHGPVLSLGEANATVEIKQHPRVTEEHIVDKIKDVEYVHHGTTTICFITMVNTFTVNGESASVHPENYDAGVGERYAYEAAFSKLWQLEGYLLSEHLYGPDEFVEMRSEL